MKKLSLLVLFMLFTSLFVTYGQVIETFDNTTTDTTYQAIIEGAPSSITLTQSSDFQEGTSALQIRTVIGALHNWGSYAQLIKRLPEGEYYDWSMSDTLSIWIKVTEAPTIPANIFFRVHVADRPSTNDAIEEYIYENATVLDAGNGWFNLKMPFVERTTDGTTIPDSTGFVLVPTTWGGGTYNNRVLDLEKIVGFNIVAVTSGWDPNANLPADSLTFIIDKFERLGLKAVPAIIFNGINVAGNLTQFTWGQSTAEVVVGAGPVPGSNAVKWTMGNEWSNGWTGMGYNVSPSFNLAGAWHKDSLQFKMKCEEGVDTLRAQFESPSAKVGIKFKPISDNQWHTYKLALQDMVPQDGTSGFDSSNVTVFGFMAEATAIAGKVVYFTDTWTGNPVFDVIPPVAPQNVLASTGTFTNLITWTDVPGETGEKYDVYYSRSPITSVNDPGIEVVKIGVLENIQLVDHMLIAPVTDQSVTYYYAVVARDMSGNASPVSPNSPATTNTAKGYATISTNAPTSTFAADGNLTEFQNIVPQVMAPSDGSGYIVPNTTITNDADCSAKSYVAFDADYLYVGIEVSDDIVSYDSTLASYLNDCPDLYVGLYNAHGLPHTTLRRSNEPDYHFRFAKNKIILDGLTDNFMFPGGTYAYTENLTGYTIEAKISLDSLAAVKGDGRFHSVEGMRLPIDYSINDADATGTREGILTYSPYNEDQSWGDVSRWLNTWIGSLWYPLGVNDKETNVDSYSLSQNYPNPFNPTTRIQYTLKATGNTTIKVYDVIGREVATIVNQMQTPGNYNINFDASKLSSGIYFYQITSGSFKQVKKMVLLK